MHLRGSDLPRMPVETVLRRDAVPCVMSGEIYTTLAKLRTLVMAALQAQTSFLTGSRS